MVHPLHEKIEHALAQRGLLKRDLARALAVSPQTATDICKGRSAVTLPHLRRLVAYFGLRADYWLDDARLSPGADDEVGSNRSGLLGDESQALTDPAKFCQNLLTFARERQADFVQRFPELDEHERTFLGAAQANSGRVGHVSAPIEVTT
ncbi:MAG: helix-turn-helix domain-containing protein [Planctomycetota bacterium]